MEPKDTYRVIATIIAKINNATKHTKGSSASTTPAEVATPFPPLNFKKIVKVCPMMAQIPMRTGANWEFRIEN